MPNWIGDAVMAWHGGLSTLLAHQFEVHCVGKKWAHDLFAGTDLIVHTAPKKLHTCRQLYKSISAKHVALLPNSFSSAMTARLSGKKTTGFNADGRRLFLSNPLTKTGHQHEAEYFYQVISETAKQGYKVSLPKIMPSEAPIPITTHAWESTQNLCNDLGQYWILCPGAVGQSPDGRSKVWTYWPEFVEAMRGNGERIIALPGPNEVNFFEDRLPGVKLIQNTSLNDFLAIATRAKGIVANDSGQMHLAANANPNTIGIFGVTDPIRTHPYGGRYIGSSRGWPSVEEIVACALEHQRN